MSIRYVCIDLVLSSSIDHTVSFYDDSDVLTPSLFPVAPVIAAGADTVCVYGKGWSPRGSRFVATRVMRHSPFSLHAPRADRQLVSAHGCSGMTRLKRHSIGTEAT